MSRFKGVATAGAFIVALGMGTGVAEAQFQRKIYTVKFLCGEKEEITASGLVREGPVKPGNYQTAINIHNPTANSTVILKRVLLLYDDTAPPTVFEQQEPPGAFRIFALPPRWGFEVDCPDIRQDLLGMAAGPPYTFLKGYITIETFLNQNKLDVVGAYTSHGFRILGGMCSVTPGPCLVNSDCPPGETCDLRKEPTGFSEDIERFEAVLLP
jgi:hypothetical protein